MFSGGKKKSVSKERRQNRDLSQFGLFDIPDDFDPSQGLRGGSDNDSDLEAELAAITSGGGGKSKPKPKEKKLVPTADLDRMIAESLRDIGSDEELSDDENDPDLLGELHELTGDPITDGVVDESEQQTDNAAPEQEQSVFLPTSTTNVLDIIKERIKMYEIAEENAKTTGELGRARRFNRGLKTLKDLLKQVNAGKNINVDDIPPEVSVKGVKKDSEENNATTPEQPQVQSPTRPAPLPPSPPQTTYIPTSAESSKVSPSEENKSSESPAKAENPKLTALNARKQEYKIAALEAKRAGDKESAIQFVKVLKQFDVVIKAAEEGQEVDLSDMPPHPNELKEFLAQMQAQAQAAAEEPPAPAQPSAAPSEPSEPEPVVESAPVTATTLLEGLQQRLEKYKSVKAAAEAEGNSGKARRFGRIVKQYEDAIKLHKAGKSIPIDELPTPPGFGPLPTENSSAPSATPTQQAPETPASAPPPLPPRPKPPILPPPKREAESEPEADSSPSGSSSSSPKKPARKHENTVRVTGNHVSTTLMEKQMTALLERQKEFKIAAIEAKKAGEIEQAKEYLKIYKGFESLLDAASGGLPVDMNTLPIPPSQRENLEDSFAVVQSEDCELGDDDSDMSVRLEEQLAKQLMMCKNTRDHHRAMGDVAGMNRFENLALSVQKDLDLVRYSRRKKFPLPKFHYEQKSFNIVHCNTDLTDNEVEINIIRGITYSVPNPKDVDTYVKIEFPYPQETPFRTRTTLVKNTDSPDYDQKFKVEIQRTNRQCQRVFKRHGVKFEIYSRGCCLDCGICSTLPMCCFSGFLRSDPLIGTVTVKLQPLETKCEIHDSFDLMDGRKTVGGKLEVRIRVRNPILTKQIEHLNEKWLILDH